MARRSPWQQFGDSFDSTYGTFNKIFQGIETAGIMREKPEEEKIQFSDSPGLTDEEGPHNSYERATGKWTYDGQTYDEPITREQLTGLRNQRLTDVMTKYGDIKGGMDLQLRREELKQKTLTNELKERTLDSDVTVAKQNVLLNDQNLTIGKVRIDQATAEHQAYLDKMPAEKRAAYAKAAGMEIDNQGKIIAVAIDAATQEDVIRGVKLGVTAKEIAIMNAELAGQNLKIDIEGNLVDLEVTKATKGFKIEGKRLDNVKKILENSELKISNEGNLLDLEKSRELFDAELYNERLKLSVEKQGLEAKQAFNQVYADHAAQSKLSYEEGGFKNQEEANKSLMDALAKVPGGPALVRELETEYRTHELAGITHQGTALKQKSMLALQKGGIDGLAKEIDEMNGVDKKVRVDRKGSGANTVVTLTEVDADGRTIRIIATGNEKNGEFMKNLDMALDPANMMETAKEYYDVLKKQADVAYTEASTEHKKQETEGLKSAKTKFDKEDFFVKLLMENPEDTMAWAGLVGMDLSMEEIEEKVLERTALKALDNASGGDGGDDGDGTSTTAGGLAQNGNNVLLKEHPRAPLIQNKKKDDNWMGTVTDLNDNAVLRKNRAGYSNHTKSQVDLTASEKIQNQQMIKANKEVMQRVRKITEGGSKHKLRGIRRGRALDRNLSASDRMDQDRRYRLKGWLEANPHYFLNNISQLDAFEKNPDKWFQTNIEYEQDKTYGL